MSEEISQPLAAALNWMTAHTRFPGERLPGYAERLLLLAAIQQYEEITRDSNPMRGMHRTDDNPLRTSQKAIAKNRSHAHFKCDNSAKV